MGQITKRAYTLSDGRDLFYFDDADSSLPSGRGPDLREPAARPPTATMRQDVLTGEWISIAAARQNRVVLPPSHLDPLAPASPGNASEIPSLYDVAVFENKSPAFGPSVSGPGAPEGLADLASVGLGRSRLSVGRCEVVCFSPEHTGSLAGVSLSRMRTVVEAWADRTAALSRLPGVEQVFPFENRGEAIGVTLHHPHGQIYAYPFITPRTAQLARSIENYGAGMFEDILGFERQSERVVLQGEHWTAFVPFAARWPLEVHVLPHRHVPDLAATSDAERTEFSRLYRRLLRGVDELYTTPTPYISAWHQAPVNAHRDEIRLMLQLTSPRREETKLKYLAGSEAAMGAFIADIPPETAAARLRNAIEHAIDKEGPAQP
ncbi:MAG: galactose-1-phosphate uridylyltransferase [Arthrobacter sp.]|nr:galactose-1-phosphate uridylyltransferase [Arthrobacter sp.]